MPLTSGMKKGNNKLVSKKPCSLDKSIVSDDVPIEVIPGLFIGSVHCAFNEIELQKAGITHIVNAAGLPATFPHLFQYLNISIRDKEYANILTCIPISNSFISSALDKGKKDQSVLVHCSFGRSRSPALVIAFLMKLRGYSLQEARDLVKRQRAVVSINPSFEDQLAAYERANFDIHGAHQDFLRMRVVKNQEEKSEEQKGKLKCFKSHQPAISTVFSSITQKPIVIPSLMSMDLEFVCLQCRSSLFHSNDVLKPTLEDRARGFDEGNREFSLSHENVFDGDDEGEDNEEKEIESSEYKFEGCQTKRTRSGRICSSPRTRSTELPEPSLSPLKRSSSAQSLLSVCSEQSESEPMSARSVEPCRETAQKRCGMRQRNEWLEKMCFVSGVPSFRSLSDDLRQLIDVDVSSAKFILAEDSVHLAGPLDWMDTASMDECGPLHCPGCSKAIGNYGLESPTISSWNESILPHFTVFSSLVGTRTPKLEDPANSSRRTRQRSRFSTPISSNCIHDNTTEEKLRN